MADAHEIALEGLDKVQAAVKAVQDRFKSCQAATEALTADIIKQVSAASGLSEKWITQALKVEINRQKLKDLTEQTVKYGLAAVDSVQRKAVGAWQLATATITGFALAGIRSSALADIMGIRMDILSRTVGGLVAPEFMKLIGLVEQLTAWIQRLDPAQKEMVAHWIEMSAVGLTLSRMFGGWIGLLGGVMLGMGQGGEAAGKFSETGKRLMEVMEKLTPVLEAIADVVASTLNVVLDVLNALIDNNALRWVAAVAAGLLFASMAIKVVAAITTIVTALKALTAAKIVSLAMSGPAGWAALATGAAVAVTALAGAKLAFDAFSGGTDKASKAHKGLREELAKKSSGLEGIEATYNRIANASVNVGMIAGPGKGGRGGQGIFGEVGSAFERSALEVLEGIRQNTGGTREGVERIRPAIGK